jgi:membrane protein DedA with SNARE-associated domain
LSFWLGQRYHQEILLSWPLNRYPQFIGRSEAFINGYGVTSVFLARFTAVVRAFVPLVAGILGMPPRQFYAANVLSALAWAPAHVFPGVLLAMAISLAGASAGQLSLLIFAGLVAVSAAVGAIRFYLNRHPQAGSDSLILPLNVQESALLTGRGFSLRVARLPTPFGRGPRGRPAAGRKVMIQVS